MKRKILIALAISVPLVFTGTATGFAETPKKLLQAPAPLTKMLKQIDSRLLRRQTRPIRTSASVSYSAKADLAIISVSITGEGATVGEAVTALSAKKAELIKSAAEQGIAIKTAELSTLNVRSQRRRSYNNEKSPVYRGTASISVSFPIGEDLLATIAKVTNGKVSQIIKMNYSYSDALWQKITADIKQQLRAKSQKQAESLARGRTIGKIFPSNARLPQRPTYQRQRVKNIRASARYVIHFE